MNLIDTDGWGWGDLSRYDYSIEVGYVIPDDPAIAFVLTVRCDDIARSVPVDRTVYHAANHIIPARMTHRSILNFVIETVRTLHGTEL